MKRVLTAGSIMARGAVDPGPRALVRDRRGVESVMTIGAVERTMDRPAEDSLVDQEGHRLPGFLHRQLRVAVALKAGVAALSRLRGRSRLGRRETSHGQAGQEKQERQPTPRAGRSGGGCRQLHPPMLRFAANRGKAIPSPPDRNERELIHAIEVLHGACAGWGPGRPMPGRAKKRPATRQNMPMFGQSMRCLIA